MATWTMSAQEHLPFSATSRSVLMTPENPGSHHVGDQAIDLQAGSSSKTVPELIKAYSTVSPAVFTPEDTDTVMVDATSFATLSLSSSPTPTSPSQDRTIPAASIPTPSTSAIAVSTPVAASPLVSVPTTPQAPTLPVSKLLATLTLLGPAFLTTDALLTTPPTCNNSPSALMTGDAMTFFDDVVNEPQQSLSLSMANIGGGGLTRMSPALSSIPELYHGFFENHPELCNSEQTLSDAEMELDMDLDEDVPAIRARTLAEMRRASIVAAHVQVPLIADRLPKPETIGTIDTINLMNHPQQQQQSPHLSNGGAAHTHGQAQQHHNHSNGNSAASNGNNNNNNNHNHDDDQGSVSSPDQNQHSHAPQRRKKASRACFHCQKAHLTCDDSRPCQRCIKRDLATTCADGVRKKAKYLQDAYDAQQLAAEQSGQGGPGMDLAGMDQQLLSDQEQQRQGGGGGGMDGQLTDTNALFNFPMSADYGFGSEAVNLEYSIISTMLSSPTAELSPMSDLSIVESWQRQGSLDAMANMANNNQLQKALAAQSAAAAAASASSNGAVGAGTPTTSGAMSNGGVPAHHNGNNTSNITNNSSAGLLSPVNGGGAAPTANGAGNTTSTFQHPSAARVSKRKFPSNTPENVYANTKQPFNYTDGFHYLLRYVRER
ncbi:hypothetical protein EDD21DRAFT_176157 [Dissophora ornata]|nr:hypothetical protein EDD21DRAFT_176157 [Dissophora ornata]